MIGAIAGDIIGSTRAVLEQQKKNYNDPLFLKHSTFTFASVMILSICESIRIMDEDHAKALREYLQQYNRRTDNGVETRDIGYRKSFLKWAWNDKSELITDSDSDPVIRAIPIGWISSTVQETLSKTKTMVEVTHDNNSVEKASMAISLAIHLARYKKSKQEIKEALESRFRIDLDYPLDFLQQNSDRNDEAVHVASVALSIFFQSDDYEDAIRKSLTIGGNSDIICTITGGIAEAYFGVPNDIAEYARNVLKSYKEKLNKDITNFENKFGYRVIKPQYSGISRRLKGIRLNSNKEV